MTWSSSRHSTCSVPPPGVIRLTLRPVRLVRAAATTEAQAAEPQALVRPAPRSQVRMIMRLGRGHLGDGDVGALGEDRVVFEQRAEAVELIGPDVAVDPEDGVRIAHRDGRGRMQHRRVDRADLQLDHAGVAEFLGQRNVLPAETRHAHVDRDRAVGMFLGVEDAGDGSRR